MSNKRWKHWFDTLYFYQLILLFRPASVIYELSSIFGTRADQPLSISPSGSWPLSVYLSCFPYWRLLPWLPLLFLPAFILAFLFRSLPTSIFVSLTPRFIIELYPRTSRRFDQAGNKSSVASKLLLHTYTWVQMVKAKGRWDVREREKKGERRERRTRADK